MVGTRTGYKQKIISRGSLDQVEMGSGRTVFGRLESACAGQRIEVRKTMGRG